MKIIEVSSKLKISLGKSSLYEVKSSNRFFFDYFGISTAQEIYNNANFTAFERPIGYL